VRCYPLWLVDYGTCIPWCLCAQSLLLAPGDASSEDAAGARTRLGAGSSHIRGLHFPVGSHSRSLWRHLLNVRHLSASGYTRPTTDCRYYESRYLERIHGIINDDMDSSRYRAGRYRARIHRIIKDVMTIAYIEFVLNIIPADALAANAARASAGIILSYSL